MLRQGRLAARPPKGEAPARDDRRVADREGRRFWLYREGLRGAETAQARWFAHGVLG